MKTNFITIALLLSFRTFTFADSFGNNVDVGNKPKYEAVKAAVVEAYIDYHGKPISTQIS